MRPRGSEALGRFGVGRVPLLVTALDVQSVDETFYHNQAVESLAAISAASVPVLIESPAAPETKFAGAAEALGFARGGLTQEFLPDSLGLCGPLSSACLRRRIVRSVPRRPKPSRYIRGKAR